MGSGIVTFPGNGMLSAAASGVMIAAMAELSSKPINVIRRSLRPPRPVPPGAVAGLAALVSLRARYADLERDELAAIDTVLDAGGTWTHIAGALGLGSRQAARQHGQRLRQRVEQRQAPHPTPDAPAPGPGFGGDASDGASTAAQPVPPRRQPRRTTRRRRRRSGGR
jgi:hypothetical protein